MKKIIALFIALISFSCSKAQKTEFESTTLSESLLTTTDNFVQFDEILKNHAGKTIFIDVWASWCGDCVKAMPTINQIHKDNSDVDFIYISMDKKKENWLAGIERLELKGEHYFAPNGMKGLFAKSIDLDWIPRYIIIDKTGKIVIYRATEKDFDLIKKTLTEQKREKK